MAKTSMKTLENVESMMNSTVETITTETTKTVMPTWAIKVKEQGIAAQDKFMETGSFFNGRAGEKVRGIFLEEGLNEGETKNGSAVWKIQVMRLSSHKEQTLSLLQSITSLSDQLVAIAMNNNGSLKEVFFDATFVAGKGQQNYIKTIVQVKPAQITEKKVA
jgi:hypothetical protein